MSTVHPDEKVCPFCAEVIEAAAVKCRHCQRELGGAAAAAPPTLPGTDPTAAPGTAPDGFEREHVDDGAPPPVRFLGSFRLLLGLVALDLALCCVLGVVWWRGEHRDEGAAPEGAITSTEARNEGMQAATELTQKVLSYDWKTLDAESKANQAVLAPSFRKEYSQTLAKVKAEAVSNHVKLAAEAQATSIVSATENKVVSLVFLDQTTTAKDTPNRRVDSSRVLVTLTRSGGDWRISKLKAF